MFAMATEPHKPQFLGKPNPSINLPTYFFNRNGSGLFSIFTAANRYTNQPPQIRRVSDFAGRAVERTVSFSD